MNYLDNQNKSGRNLLFIIIINIITKAAGFYIIFQLVLYNFILPVRF